MNDLNQPPSLWRVLLYDPQTLLNAIILCLIAFFGGFFFLFFILLVSESEWISYPILLLTIAGIAWFGFQIYRRYTRIAMDFRTGLQVIGKITLIKQEQEKNKLQIRGNYLSGGSKNSFQSQVTITPATKHLAAGDEVLLIVSGDGSSGAYLVDLIGSKRSSQLQLFSSQKQQTKTRSISRKQIYFMMGSGGILFSLGIILIYFVLSAKVRAEDIQTWPTTYGMVKSHSVETKEVETSSGGSYWGGDTSSTYTIYCPKASYSFSVEYKDYNSEHIYYDDQCFNEPDEANQALNQFQVDSKVLVYYNPRQPQDAVLVKPARLGSWATTLSWLIGIGILLPSLGLVGAGLYLWRQTL